MPSNFQVQVLEQNFLRQLRLNPRPLGYEAARLPILPPPRPPQRFVGEWHVASNLDLVMVEKSFEIIRLFSIWPLCSFTVNKYRIINIFLFTVYVTNQKESGSCRAHCKKAFPGPKKRSRRLQSTSLSGQNRNRGGTSLALGPKINRTV